VTRTVEDKNEKKKENKNKVRGEDIKGKVQKR